MNTSKLWVLDTETLLNTGEVLLPFQAMGGWLCSEDSALVLLRVNDEMWRLESFFVDDFSVVETPEFTVSLKETKFDGAGMLSVDNDVEQIVALLNEHFGGAANVKKVCMNAAGCVLVLQNDQRAYYFGKAANFGFADEQDTFRPVLLHSESNLVDVKLSSNFLMFETADGRLGFVGKYHGTTEVDRPSSSRKSTTASISLLESSSRNQPQTLAHAVRSFACNSGSMALIDRRGNLRIFGKESNGLGGAMQAGATLRMKKLTQVALGKAHVVLVASKDGCAYSFGLNQYGQCGQGAVASASNFRLSLGLVAVVEAGEEFRVLTAVCGNFHTVLLSDVGLVASCGLNRYGQLGIANFDNQSQPVKLL